MKSWTLYLLSILLIAGVFNGCKKTVEFDSFWRTAEITIDGDESDWENGLTYFEKEGVGLGIRNDEDNLYIILKTYDRTSQLQVIRNGLTIWFDPEGKKKKRFGIRYPIGLQEYGIFPSRRGAMDFGEPQITKEEFAEMLREIEIIQSGEKTRIPRIAAPGIRVAMSDQAGPLVYEIKIPLRADDELLYAIGTHAGTQIGVGFETGEIKREDMMSRRGSGMSGGRPGGGMGGGGGRGGMGGQRQPPQEMPSPMKTWMKLNLASE